MWVLIAFAAYILVNVSIKTIVPLLHLDDSLPIKNGKVVVAKGTKKGTYKVTVKVKGAENYKDAKKVITVKVK